MNIYVTEKYGVRGQGSEARGQELIDYIISNYRSIACRFSTIATTNLQIRFDN
jgi:hypothetical protein